MALNRALKFITSNFNTMIYINVYAIRAILESAVPPYLEKY